LLLPASTRLARIPRYGTEGFLLVCGISEGFLLVCGISEGFLLMCCISEGFLLICGISEGFLLICCISEGFLLICCISEGFLLICGISGETQAYRCLDLPDSGPMDQAMDRRDVQEHYEPAPTPTLYVGQASNVPGRVPSMPLFLLGNATPTIAHELREHQRNRVPHGRTDTAQESGRRGSDVHELDAWPWQFGRGKPRVGGLSVADTGDSDRRIAGLLDGPGSGVAMPRGRRRRTEETLKAQGGSTERPLLRRMIWIGHQRISLVYLETSHICNICLRRNKLEQRQ
jgi:hypothetical protein